MRAKIGFVVAALITLAFAIAVIFQAQIGNMAFKRGVEQNLARDALAALEDGIHIGLCGTGSPMPNPHRAGPCNVVIVAERMFVVDIGEGGARNISLMGINTGNLDGVFLTHFHSDHIDGLGTLRLARWIRGTRTTPLPVYGPSGVTAVVDGFNAAYAIDDTYRTAHHGEDVAPPNGSGLEAQPFVIEGDSIVVLEQDQLTITAFTVDHDPVDPAMGYRFDYKGRSLCISGDTLRSANLEHVCSEVDLIVHEALQPAMITEMQEQFTGLGNNNAAKIMLDIKDYHASPEDAAESAQAVGAKMLVLSHLVPPLPSAYLHPAFLGGAESRFSGELIVGEDGMLFSLPADTEAIAQTKLM